MLELKVGMLVKIHRKMGSVAPTSQPDDDSHIQIVRIRELETFKGSDRVNVIGNEIGPDVEFSYGSQLHRQNIEAFEFPSIKEKYKNSRARLVEPDMSYHDLKKMRDYWLKEAVDAQELAFKRRPLWEKITAYAGFWFVYVPYKLIEEFFDRRRGPRT